MAIVVRVIDEDWQSVNPIPHITVGTRGDEVKPKESNDVLKRWLEVGSGEDSGIGELVIAGPVILKGNVQGVHSK
jgi:tRNA ligase